MGTYARTRAGGYTGSAAVARRIGMELRSAPAHRPPWSCEVPAQRFDQPAQRLPAVADAVLGRQIQLGCGAAQVRQKEQRVVAEAAAAARLAQHAALPAALADDGNR